MMFPPVKIIDADYHSAKNSPLGVRITTGTRYFAATLLQEVYEARRYMAWYWLPAIIFGLVAFLTGIVWIAVAIPIWMMLVGRGLAPLALGDRELMGQAISLAAIDIVYDRVDMESEYQLQARSMVRRSSSYSKKGLWPDIPKIGDTVAHDSGHPSIERMVLMLKGRRPAAQGYVLKNIDLLNKWRALGAESKGY